MKKLIPGELYDPPELLPLVEADKSFTEATPSTSNENATPGPSGEKQVKKPMVITIGKKTFKLVQRQRRENG